MKHYLQNPPGSRGYFRRGMAMILLLMSISLVSYAQKEVKGVITDAKTAQTIPGVAVSVKSTTRGTVTDLDGKFSISVSSEDDILVFSFVGYKTIELPVNGKTSMDLEMEEEETLLEQVVVVGYGTQKKVNLTGAIDQVDGGVVAKRPIANVMQGLQGLSPGLNITYANGKPGTVPGLNVRGFTSINGGEPLFVIDGIASDKYDLLRLNPSDIESYSVLRDAASAAIYGARGAYGVVLITTKKGKEGKQKVSYSNYFAWGKPTLLPEPITDPYIYSRVLETATDNTPWDYVNYSDAHYQWAKERSDNPSVEDVRLDPNNPNRWAYMGSNDWYDYFFNSASFSTSHRVSVSGMSSGSLPIGYYLSGDYTNENGLNKLTPDYWDRYALKARITVSPIKWLNLDNNLSVYQTERADPTSSITDIYYLQPTDVAVNPDGTWANTGAGRLAARLTDGGRNREDMFGFHNIFRGVGTFLNGDLTVTGNASFKREEWKYHWDRQTYDIGFGPDDVRTEGGDGSVAERNGILTHNVFDFYANYNKTLGKHHFSLMTGYNQEDYVYSSLQTEKRVLISSTLPYIGLTTGDIVIAPDYTTYALRGVFGRAHYRFKERYILEFNGRYDGSSRFPKSNRWGFFPSVSTSWLVMDEEFFKPLTNLVSTFKLRASHGTLGDQKLGDFGYISSLPTDRSGYLINGERNTVITGAPALNVDPSNYTWPTVVNRNIGLDLGVKGDQLFASFDYFIRDSKDMIAPSVELPGVLGTTPPSQNVADARTKGWELTLEYKGKIGDISNPLNFNTKLLLSDSQGEITRYKNENNLLNQWRVGQKTGEIWGLKNDGFFNTTDEIEALDQSSIVPWGALDIVPGWPKYMDLDGNGKIERGQTANDPKDLSVIGNSTSRYRYGFNLNMDWNGFDLSVFLQGVGKRDYYPKHYLFWGPYQQPYANIYPWNLDFYRGEADSDALMAQHSQSYLDAGLADVNTDSEFPVLQAWLADANYGGGLDIPQSGYLKNAAYLRVKNVTLGYSLPRSIT
ncbi:SusC/RagA family TonB-linked outer membrane protein, partial [Echinicola sediminis]